MKPHAHPDGETRKDRFRQAMVGLGVAIILLSGIGNVVEGFAIIRSGEAHHQQDNDQNTAIIKVLDEHSASLKAVAGLQKEFSDFVNTAGPKIETGQSALVKEMGKICAAIPACADGS